MYLSDPIALFVWHQLKNRVDNAIVTESDLLRHSLQAKKANVDTATVMLQRAAEIRSTVDAKLLRIEHLLTFSLQIESQLMLEEFKAEIPMLEAQIARFNILTKDLLHFIIQQPGRLLNEQDLIEATTSMSKLDISGNGDRIQEERTRIRAIERPVQPIGQEDCAEFRQKYASNSMSLDELQAKLLALKHGHLVQMRFPFEMQSLLNEFEVRSRWEENPDFTEPTEENLEDTADIEQDDAEI
jgi:hypothetical protein